MRFILTLALFSTLTFFVNAQTNDAVTITSLNAVPRGTQVLLSWNPDKKDIVGYKVERSKNGSEFEMFSEVEGSDQPVEFIETDFAPLAGLSYYRLSAVLQDGRVIFSNVVPVKFSATTNATSPVQAYTKEYENGVLVIVRSAMGDEFYSKVEVENAIDPIKCKDADPALAHGTYTIVACSDQELYSKQIIVD